MITPYYFAGIINKYVGYKEGALVNGMLLGIPLQTNPGLYLDLRVDGLLHLVVLSGTNISFIESWVSGISSIFGRKLGIVITEIVVLFFVLLVGFQAPIMRAFVMNVYTSVAIFSHRKPLTLLNLLVSLAIVLLLWPEWISSFSLYLSYGATLGLVLFSRSEDKAYPNFVSAIFGYLTQQMRTSIAAQILITPLLIFKFHQVSFISPLANAAVAWLVPYIMILGFFIILFNYIFPPFSIGIGFLEKHIVSLFFFITHMVARIPYASISVK